MVKNKGGRPSKIDKIDLSKVKFLTKNGFTDEQLAEVFCVTRQTICNWKKEYPVFFDTLKQGKMLADASVEASLYQRACGYSHLEEKIFCSEGRVTKVNTIKHYPPDPTSMIFWLKNRQPQDWRDKREVEHSGELNLQALLSDEQ